MAKSINFILTSLAKSRFLGNMFGSFRNTTQHVYQKLIGKIEKKQEPVIVCDTRKVDLSII